jgi:hypothetical protein
MQKPPVCKTKEAQKDRCPWSFSSWATPEGSLVISDRQKAAWGVNKTRSDFLIEQLGGSRECIQQKANLACVSQLSNRWIIIVGFWL